MPLLNGAGQTGKPEIQRNYDNPDKPQSALEYLLDVMRRSLTILFILNLIAAGTLIVKVESLIEGVEVAADSLPRFVKELAKPDIDSSDRFQKLADHQVSSIERNRDYAQHVRVVVQLTALLLVINAAFFWYVRRRWHASVASPTDLSQQR